MDAAHLEATNNFIESVRAKQALWNKASKDFKEGKRKPQMWEDLAQEHGFEDGDAAKKRWGYLRDYYVKTKNKQVASGSGADDEVVTWAYYDQLSFLDGTLEPRKGRVSSRITMQPPPARSQVDLFAYDDDDEESLNSSTKDEPRPAGEPTPKRVKQERLSLEKRFIGVMESTAQQRRFLASLELPEHTRCHRWQARAHQEAGQLRLAVLQLQEELQLAALGSLRPPLPVDLRDLRRLWLGERRERLRQERLSAEPGHRDARHSGPNAAARDRRRV